VGAYTFPVKASTGEPLVGKEVEEHPLPDAEADFEEHELPWVEDEDTDKEDDGKAAIKEVPKGMQRSKDIWDKLIDEATDVKIHSLTLVETLENRSTAQFLEGVARFYARLRSLQLPVLRLHSDRAGEMISRPVQQWCLDRSIVQTATPADDWKANGRAEQEIGNIKRLTRVLLKSAGIANDYWPLAARHAGERRLRRQLKQVGWEVPQLLPFGARAWVVKKRWKDRNDAWRDSREQVRILGPDRLMSMTSQGYYCQSIADGNCYSTTDVVIPETDPEADPPQPADEDLPVVELRDNRVVDLTVDAPRRRLRTKTAVPHLAALLGGEGIHQLQQPRSQQQEGQRNLVAEAAVGLDLHQEQPDSRRQSWIGNGAELGQAQTHSPRDAEGLEVIYTHGLRSAEGQTTDTHPMADPTAGDNLYENLRQQHEALGNYVTQEMRLLDGGEADQAAWLPVVAEAMVCKAEVEQELIQCQKDQDQEQEEKNFLVTRTVSAMEVQEHLQEWEEAVKEEYR